MTLHTTEIFDKRWENDTWNVFSALGNGREIVILGKQNSNIFLGFNKFQTVSFFGPKETALKTLIEKRVIKRINLDKVTLDDNVLLELTQKGINLFAELKNKPNADEFFVKTLNLKRPI